MTETPHRRYADHRVLCGRQQRAQPDGADRLCGTTTPSTMSTCRRREFDFYPSARTCPTAASATNSSRSSVTGRTETCLVYLPARVRRPPGKGVSGAVPAARLRRKRDLLDDAGGIVNFILDNEIAAGTAVPMIVVMCNGMLQLPGDGGRSWRHADPACMEDFLLHDVIPFVEGRFRCLTDRDHRAMAGLSMGSFQTCWTTFRHLDLFSYAGPVQRLHAQPAHRRRRAPRRAGRRRGVPPRAQGVLPRHGRQRPVL